MWGNDSHPVITAAQDALSRDPDKDTLKDKLAALTAYDKRIHDDKHENGIKNVAVRAEVRAAERAEQNRNFEAKADDKKRGAVALLVESSGGALLRKAERALKKKKKEEESK